MRPRADRPGGFTRSGPARCCRTDVGAAGRFPLLARQDHAEIRVFPARRNPRGHTQEDDRDDRGHAQDRGGGAKKAKGRRTSDLHGRADHGFFDARVGTGREHDFDLEEAGAVHDRIDVCANLGDLADRRLLRNATLRVQRYGEETNDPVAKSSVKFRKR